MGKDNRFRVRARQLPRPPALDRKALESQLVNAGSPEECRAELARIFVCDSTKSPLRLEKELRFLFPSELTTAGINPDFSSTAVAAHTAVSKKVELFNNFTKIKHASIFESVKPAGASGEELRPAIIQKLMSAPVLDKADDVLGVIRLPQRFRSDLGRPGFHLDDLQTLEIVAGAGSGWVHVRGR
jgi:hypothetical protein